MEAVTHLEKVIVGEVSAVTHLEKVIAGETSAVTYTEKVITGEAPPITHLQRVIAGVESPVTHLEYIWAGGSPTPTEHEYTGVVPYTFIANGSPLMAWRISGNTVQNGTPTPDNPIMPEGTGERTGNLFDKDNAVIGERVLQNSVITDADMAHSDYIDVTGISTITVNKKYKATNFYFYADKTSNSIGYVNVFTANVPTGAKYCRINVLKDDVDTIMLNTGSTPLPYEPYGYKIPISSANTTTPVYLGEVETTRQIKKFVLDGTEKWNEGTSNYYIFIDVQGRGEGVPNSNALCTHAENGVVVNNNGTALFFKKSVIVQSSLADFKTYLQQQYAAGTPVCVWYVLTTPETAVVNEPLMRIGDYADEVSNVATIPTVNGSNTFDVDTTVKPSEVYIKYKGV